MWAANYTATAAVVPHCSYEILNSPVICAQTRSAFSLPSSPPNKILFKLLGDTWEMMMIPPIGNISPKLFGEWRGRKSPQTSDQWVSISFLPNATFSWQRFGILAYKEREKRASSFVRFGCPKLCQLFTSYKSWFTTSLKCNFVLYWKAEKAFSLFFTLEATAKK